MSEVLSNIVNVFPLSVYINDVPEHESLKERLLDKVKSLPAYDPHTRYAWTGDVKGHGFIHLDEDFKPWLDAMVPHIHRYLELLRLRTEHLDIYFQRSWPTLAKRNQAIASHNHENCHISLVYYLSKPEHSGGLRLLMPNPPNEIVPNLFGSSVAVQPFFHERTPCKARPRRTGFPWWPISPSCSTRTPSARNSCRPSRCGRRSDASMPRT